MQLKRCLMITGGSIDMNFAGKLLKNQIFGLTIGVDAGVKQAAKLGIALDMAVGDFDTLGEENIKKYDIKHVMKLCPQKDETDTEAAVHYILSQHPEEVWILGATGGRMDHTLANIHLLACFAGSGVQAWIFDANNKISMIDRDCVIKKDSYYGKYFSFLPYTENVTGLSLRGFAYPLENADISIHRAQSLGISNEFLDETAEIKIKSGMIIAIQSRD